MVPFPISDDLRQRIEQQKLKVLAKREQREQEAVQQQQEEERRQEEERLLEWRAESSRSFSSATSGALMIFGPSGWGKSRLMGRYLCFENLRRGIGTVVIDPVGGTIDNLLDKVRRHAPELEEKILYCNMAGESVDGETYITPWPMLERRYPDESLYTASQRMVDLIAKTDRNFAGAAIQGLARLTPILTSVSIILGLFGLPLVRVFDLLNKPHEWREYLQRAKADPEGRAAAEHLEDELFNPALTPRMIRDWTEPLKNRLSLLRFDQVARAMFCAPESLINWDEVCQNGKIVLLDFRQKGPAQAHELKLFWVWNSLMEYIISRDSSGYDYPPLAVVIDEMSTFTRGVHLNTEIFIQEFQDFIQARRRNANIQFAAATQEQYQLPEDMLKACLQIPSQLYGATTDVGTALELAERWYEFDPWATKQVERRGEWHSHTQRMKVGQRWRVPIYKDKTTTWFEPDEDDPGAVSPTWVSLEEQRYLNSLNFINLEKGEWLLGKADGDAPAKTLQPVTTNFLDEGEYIERQAVVAMRQRLMQRHGLPLSQVLSQIDSSGEAAPTGQPVHPEPKTKGKPRNTAGKERKQREDPVPDTPPRQIADLPPVAGEPAAPKPRKFGSREE